MLIVYAHPNKDGHCGYILSQVKSKLEKKKIKYEILDLYKMKYGCALQPEEHYTSGHKEVSEETKRIQEKIKSNDKFIFIYPVWWNNMPGILKGFIDRVFVSGFAFHYQGHLPHGLLEGRAVIFSSSGSSRLIEWLWSRNRALKILARDTLGFCGIKTKAYLVGSARELNNKQKRRIRKMVKKGMKFLI